MSFVIEDVLVRNDPVGRVLPLLFDSPHSGAVYPADFQFCCPLPTLRHAEDTYVDELFAAAPEFGGTLLCALFPRSYIDVNRAIDDIDPGLLDGSWPLPLRPTEKSALGMGLIRALCRPGLPLYDGKLPVWAVAERIDRYYRPYHFQVASVMDDHAARFGAVWHIDCHSMPSAAGGMSGGPLADFVIGDRDGTTCEPGFVALVADTLEVMGYSVALNNPYKGVELIARYANPARGRHSIQLEVNRRLYMNEQTLQKNAGFDRLQADLTALIRRIAVHVEARTLPKAAE